MYQEIGICNLCKNTRTEDDEKYGGLCQDCCASAWRLYELAHGGDCLADIKRAPVSSRLKAYILARDGKCLKCGSDENLTIDHIVPVSRGGSNRHDNLQVLCRCCNSIKSSYPADYREVIEL